MIAGRMDKCEYDVWREECRERFRRADRAERLAWLPFWFGIGCGVALIILATL